MATGIPKSNGSGGKASLRLEYDGKKSVTDILATEAARLGYHGHTGGDNLLIFSENLAALAALAKDPEVVGKVRLIYIDPPFATKSSFHSRKLAHAYEDTLDGADFLEFLRERLVFLHRLLADDGSLYLHIDERMVFHVKLVLDEIFGASNYRNCITRKKCNPKNYTRKSYGNVADYILFYTKSDNYAWNRPLEPWTAARSAKEYQYIDEASGRRYKKVPIHAPGVRNGETGKPWRGMMPPAGKHWQYTPAKLDELDAAGDIYWSPTGNPRRKVYLDESGGVPVQDIWLEFRDAHNQNIHITGYPTEKPLEMLKQIILASSNPGDLVLDCFCGSGTTLAAAATLGRKWIGIDKSPEAIRTTLKRLEYGTEPMGDFVAERQQEEQRILHLFDDLPATPKKGGEHIPVTDFTCLIQEGLTLVLPEEPAVANG